MQPARRAVPASVRARLGRQSSVCCGTRRKKQSSKHSTSRTRLAAWSTPSPTCRPLTGAMVTVFWSVYRAISSAADACVCAVAGIDPNDPEAQRAATKIQAVFRGHKTRKTMRAGDENDQNEPTEAELAAEFRADDKELCNAATKIQAQFRGHMARKTGPKEKTAEELSKEMEKLDAKEEVDIDLTDPELHKAASKIQASFRGHKARKEGDPKDGDDAKGGDSAGASGSQ